MKPGHHEAIFCLSHRIVCLGQTRRPKASPSVSDSLQRFCTLQLRCNHQQMTGGLSPRSVQVSKASNILYFQQSKSMAGDNKSWLVFAQIKCSMQLGHMLDSSGKYLNDARGIMHAGVVQDCKVQIVSCKPSLVELHPGFLQL